MASDELGNTTEGSGHLEPAVEVATAEEPRGESELPNPFWSERATEEFRLRQARPLELAEYDDRQLEPDYNGSEAERSAGYRSVDVVSARAASPLPTGEAQGLLGAPREGVSSGVPSVSSRSRSPIREDFATMKELLVSFGGAIASLAEEHRTTQQRLARVEELKSGSNSSMRTGREDGEVEGAGIENVLIPVGPQVFYLDEGDRLKEDSTRREGGLPLEDWEQPPLRLEDIPQEALGSGPLGVPDTYIPTYNTGALPSAQVRGFEAQPHALPSAQVRGFEAQPHALPSAQVRGFEAQPHALPSAQVRGFEAQPHALPSAQVRGFEAQPHALPSAQVRGFEAQPHALPSAQVRGFEAQPHALPSAQVRGFEAQPHALPSAQVRGLEVQPRALSSAQVRGREALPGALSSAQVRGLEAPIDTLSSAKVPGLEAPIDALPSAQVRGLEAPIDALPSAQVRGFGGLGMQSGQSMTVWVDGVPRVAVVGPRGLEIGGPSVGDMRVPFATEGRQPFMPVEARVHRQCESPPPPPPPRLSSPIRFSPATPNGTRIPKGPPPADSMEWPDWTRPISEVGTTIGNFVPPPPLPWGMKEGDGSRGGEGPTRPEEPSRSVTDLPELQAFTPQEGSVLAGDWITQLSPVIGTMSATSGVWWTEVLREAYHLYTRWLVADPVQRLSIKAEATCSLTPTSRHVLIEQRLTVLLMRAVPAEIRAELVAVRAMSSLAVIVAVLCRYQPGGPNERANVLAFLVAPERPNSIENGIATCRRWLRQLQRAKELGLMLPDATLLIKGADALLGPVLTKSQQASFRLNSFRNERKLDYAPAFESIVAFGQLILAEYELLQHSEPGELKKPKLNKVQENEEETQPKGSKGKQGSGKSGGNDSSAGKGARPNGSGKEASKATCKYWCITDMGCVKASKCPDLHNKELLKGTTRCWVCSSTQHQKHD